jgi:hypothetical protein
MHTLLPLGVLFVTRSCCFNGTADSVHLLMLLCACTPAVVGVPTLFLSIYLGKLFAGTAADVSVHVMLLLCAFTVTVVGVRTLVLIICSGGSLADPMH